MADAPKPMTDAQRAYEQKRADKAGMNLDRWLAEKARRQVAEAPPPPKPEAAAPKKPNFISRLIERAHKPLGS